MLKLRTSFAIVLAVCLGCGGPSAEKPSGNGKLRIAVIPKGTTHEFWKSVHHGAARAAKELDVEILWDGPHNENDTADQIQIVENFITKRVDGICLAPNDSQALVDVVQQAKAKKIPTVVFDSGLDAADDYVSYVATDNERGGVLGAQTLAKAMGEKGRVILLRYNVGSESTHKREEGFLAELKKFPGIEIVSSDKYSGTTPETSLAACQQLLLNYRDKVEGMFAVCEPNGVGMLGALEEAGLAGKVKFVGFDSGPRLVEAMAAGKMDGIVLQDPDAMGYLAVKTMVQHLRGEKVEKRLPTGEYVAVPENMKTADMQRLLQPPLFGE